MLAADAEDGTLRSEVPVEDVLLLIGGVAYSAQRCEEPRARRLIDLVLDSLAR
ncbi:hypothetical protein [Amycolatopsis echigonensis]|uniref:hypothetical protein n=1 Tax=Amycolatopsis echigonensis TaxID=2576905 RepID=UPI0031343B37